MRLETGDVIEGQDVAEAGGVEEVQQSVGVQQREPIPLGRLDVAAVPRGRLEGRKGDGRRRRQFQLLPREAERPLIVRSVR